MSVGAVGGAGSAGASGGAAGASSPAGSSGGAAAASPAAADASAGTGGNKALGSSTPDEKSGFNVSIENNNTMQMSTQNFIEMHNSCQSSNSVSAMEGPQSGELDLQKLIEMMMLMMIMKMMQEMQG